MKRSIWIVLTTLVIDQTLKIWVKTTMTTHETLVVIHDWFQINFIENNGMAFGIEFGGYMGKLSLSLLRIVFVIYMTSFLLKLIRKNADKIIIVSLSLILAGAIGNIIDGTFYGILFSDSDNGNIATFLPKEGGYAHLFFGKVVDMFYFPIFKVYFPEWIPFWGGDQFEFFSPRFNIADSAISIGVAIMVIFQKKVMKELE